MLDVDLAGKRLPELLHLVDDPPRQRGVGEQCLPLRRKLGREVGEDRVAAA